MARSAPRKSTKKCGPRKHGRKAHMRGGKRVAATCVKNRPKKMSKKMLSKRSGSRKMRMYNDMMDEEEY
jgi:hypothetical protein